MQSILDAINEWIKEILIGAINGNLSTMFGDVNEKVGTIANEVGQTPQGWNANIFSMIQTLSENVIVPIAGLVITYVLCYELISMVTEKNNMHDIETFMFFKWIFKAFVAVFIVTNTFNITMAVFDMAQHIVSGAAGVIGGDTNIDVAEALAAMQEGLEDMEIPELLLLVLETSLVSLCMKIMSVLITVILYGRMIEIYLYCSVSPIPFATMTNREWGQIGNNYLKGLFALGFQGFLIMINNVRFKSSVNQCCTMKRATPMKKFVGAEFGKLLFPTLPCMRNGSFIPSISIFKMKKQSRLIKWQEKK